MFSAVAAVPPPPFLYRSAMPNFRGVAHIGHILAGFHAQVPNSGSPFDFD